MSSKIEEMLNQSLENHGNVMLCDSFASMADFFVDDWLNDNKDKVTGYHLDCTSLCIQSGEERHKNGLTLIGQAFTSEEIDAIASIPHMVVVADKYEFLDVIFKSHVLLLCDGYIVDEREESGFKKLDNLEFVCALN